MAALAEVSVKTAVGVLTVDYLTASFAGHQMLVCAIRAGVRTIALAERRFIFRQGLATILTFNGFHRALC